MKRLILVALMVTASWTSGAMALAGESPYGDDPVEIVRGTTSNTLEILNERRAEFEADPSGLHELVRSDLLPLIDIDYSARLILGRAGRGATPEQFVFRGASTTDIRVRPLGVSCTRPANDL